MDIVIREFNNNDINSMVLIWNGIIKEGNAFPQEEVQIGRAHV